MVFIYIGIAVIIFIVIFNIADRTVNKPKSNQNIDPRRITIDSIEKAKYTYHNNNKNIEFNNSEKHFRSAIEEALRNHIQQCIKDTPIELKHSPAVSTLIIDSTANYAQSLIDNLNQKPEIKKVFTSKQIEFIVDNIQKRLIKELVYIYNL